MVEAYLYRVASNAKKRNKGCLRSLLKPPNWGFNIGGHMVREASVCIPLFFGAAPHNWCNCRYWALLCRRTALQWESLVLSFTLQNLLCKLGRKVLLWNNKCATCQFRAAASRFGFSDRAIVVQPTKRLWENLSLGACVRNLEHRVGSSRLHDGARL